MSDNQYTLLPEDIFEKAVDILKAIAHPTRLQLMNLLSSGECQVSELIRELHITQSSMSQQLFYLRLHGVVKRRRDSNKSYYSLANNNIKNIVTTILSELKYK